MSIAIAKYASQATNHPASQSASMRKKMISGIQM